MRRTRGGRPPATAAVSEPRWVRWLLIGVALGFLGLFLLVPLVAVFAEALRQGWAAYSSCPGRPRHLVGHPPDAADGGDRRAAEHGLRRRWRPGRSPSSSSSARAC